jgi:hypothetical protein
MGKIEEMAAHFILRYPIRYMITPLERGNLEEVVTLRNENQLKEAENFNS